MSSGETGNDSTLTLRRLDADDAALAAELSSQLGYSVSSSEMRQRLERVSESHERVVLGALMNGQLVGWIDASVERHLQSPDTVVIGGLVVRDGCRNLGIGKWLCDEIEKWTRERSIDRVRVRSQIMRERAHRFYLRDGYKQVKTSYTFEKSVG